jgi:HK97 family phage portal protein
MNKFKAIFNAIFGIQPSENMLNRALYDMRVISGIATFPEDNLDSYIKEGYAGNADVYSIISRIDNMRKQAKLKLYRRLSEGENEEVDDHELKTYLHKVNASMYTDDFLSGFLIYRLVTGNTFVYYPRISAGVNRGKAGGIYLMPANDVEIITGDWMSPVKGYKLELSRQEFTSEEVYHSKFFNPLFGTDLTFYGQSPLKAARQVLGKQNQAAVTELKQFENQGPPYLLFRDASGQPEFNRLSDDQRDEMQKRIKEHASKTTRGLPLVLKEKYGVINLGAELASMNILESSREGRRALCNVYGLPSALFGDVAGSTYNNMLTARKAAWTDCIIPNLRSVEHALNEMLIAGVESYKDLYFGFDYSDVEALQEGMETKVAWMKAAGYSKNEIRQATGIYPIQQPIMDQPIFFAGETPADQMTLDNELTPDRFGDYS